jgi:hypothetical protein
MLLKTGAYLVEMEDFFLQINDREPPPLMSPEVPLLYLKAYNSSSSFSFVSSLSFFVPSFTGLEGSCSFPAVLGTFTSYWK